MLYRSALAADARGSVGGLTASRNRSGAYFRARVKPTQVPSDPRSRARADLGSQASAWNSLTKPQRDAWNDVATTWTAVNKLGEVVKLSGFNWFCRANALLSLTGQPNVIVPPDDIPTTTLHPPTALVLDVSAHSLTATIDDTDPWANTDDGRLLVFMTQGQNPGRNSPSGGFTFAAATAGDAGTPPTTISLTSLPVSLITGRVYFVRFVATDGLGRVSAEVIQSAIPVP